MLHQTQDRAGQGGEGEGDMGRSSHVLGPHIPPCHLARDNNDKTIIGVWEKNGIKTMLMLVMRLSKSSSCVGKIHVCWIWLGTPGVTGQHSAMVGL